jgi:amidase
LRQCLSISEASIQDLQTALSNGQINSVQLVAKHLIRVARFDRRGPRLNSLVVFNSDVFNHAQSSDDFRAINGSIRSALEGLPGTLKDSYMMAGLTVASGSPAFRNLTAKEDAFTVGRLRSHGGILLGKTNMPPMANGGMQRGLYGRADNPYNKAYLTSAYASGSSNGAGSSTSASFAVFAMAEETVSSGRSPASNNGLVAYTPSRGVLSIRGNWPLFPAADVPVPYARTVGDLLEVLDVIVADDEDVESDFWRGQPWVDLPAASSVRPRDSYNSLRNVDALRGKRIGVPKMYIGEYDAAAQPVWVSPDVRALWANARSTLETLGAIVEEVGFPLVSSYETRGVPGWNTSYPLPDSVNDTTLSSPLETWAYSWDDFLRMVNDSSVSGITQLSHVDPTLIFPQLPNTLPDRYGNSFGNRTALNAALVADIATRNGRSIYDIPGLEAHVKALEARRKRYLEDWMDSSNLDLLVWPSVGDVGPEDAETNNTAAELAWRNGVFFSNGNYAIRTFGVPTVSVNMGLMSHKQMPVDLTFAGRAYDDNNLLSYGYAFEHGHGQRTAPPLTPEISTDIIPQRQNRTLVGTQPPSLTEVSVTKLCGNVMKISGSINTSTSGGLDRLEIFVDGVAVAPTIAQGGSWSLLAKITQYDDPIGDVPVRPLNVPDQSLAMIIVLATANNGRSDAKLLWV